MLHAGLYIVDMAKNFLNCLICCSIVYDQKHVRQSSGYSFLLAGLAKLVIWKDMYVYMCFPDNIDIY